MSTHLFSQCSLKWPCFFSLVATCLFLSAANVFADDFLKQAERVAAGCACEEKEEKDEPCSYGPCDCCPRMTLMQWSYGTTFEGGADLDEPLVTDRPDFTESPSTVGLGVVQLEVGYTYTYDDSSTGHTKSHTYPELLMRAGVFAEWLELRVGWSYLEETTVTSGTSQTVKGSEDLYLGFKIALTPQECLLPEMGLILQMTVPSGANNITADEVLPGINWIYGWEINDFIATAGQTQINRALDDITSQPYLEFSQSWTVAYSLCENVGAYTEWYCFVPDGADTAQTEHYFNGGFTFLINNDLQLDVRAGVGLNQAADDYFVGSGFAKRF